MYELEDKIFDLIVNNRKYELIIKIKELIAEEVYKAELSIVQEAYTNFFIYNEYSKQCWMGYRRKSFFSNR